MKNKRTCSGGKEIGQIIKPNSYSLSFMNIPVGPKGLHPVVSLSLEIKNNFFRTKFFVIVVSFSQSLVRMMELINFFKNYLIKNLPLLCGFFFFNLSSILP